MPVETWLHQVIGNPAHRWQASLAEDAHVRDRLIRIPTGFGKTLGVLAAWLWNRVEREDDSWPRRLIWCLPMRVLTEQTVAEAQSALKRAGLSERVRVHTLMGGADAGEWWLHPEREGVLVGTQDMLLSRALNRGYASPRARWPMEFGLLAQDALWVYDEVQLMDVGLATSAQLQAYRDEDAQKHLRPVHSWWMSATLQPSWLQSVDTAQRYAAWADAPVTVKNSERHHGPAAATKALALAHTIPATDAQSFASLEAPSRWHHHPGGLQHCAASMRDARSSGQSRAHPGHRTGP